MSEADYFPHCDAKYEKAFRASGKAELITLYHAARNQGFNPIDAHVIALDQYCEQQRTGKSKRSGGMQRR